jgi:hypothetical protein
VSSLGSGDVSVWRDEYSDDVSDKVSYSSSLIFLSNNLTKEKESRQRLFKCVKQKLLFFLVDRDFVLVSSSS